MSRGETAGAPGLTIGVLSPYVGGSYYGDILAGVASATSAAGGRVVAVQTLEAGSYKADSFDASEFRAPIAWDHVAGFVVIANAVDAGYLQALRAAGKSVVMVSHEYPDFPCPVVLPDNGGIRDAVAHLIEHGHRRIAFVGYLSVSDVQERFTGYLETLREHGIEPDPLLFFEATDNHEEGGDHAARAMIAAGLPSTAVVVATDLNAIGVMRTLTAAGHRVPRDQAVVGFDDIDAARHVIPSLSSVRQSMSVLGQTAVDLLLRLQRGEDVPAGRRYVPAPFVARESCGCPDPALVDDVSSPPGGPTTVPVGGGTLPDPDAGAGPRERLVHALAPLLIRDGSRAEERVAFHQGVEAIVALIDAAARCQRAPVVAHLRHELHGLYNLDGQPEHLPVMTQAVRAFGAEVAAAAGDDAATGRIEDRLHELTLALSEVAARMQFNDTQYFQAMLATQYQMSMGLLRSHEEDPRALGWLVHTPARGGCLGLWSQQPDGVADPDRSDRAGSDRELEIVGVFARDRVQVTSYSPRVAVSAFPPAETLALADETAGDVTFVVPVRISSSDWGLLAVVGGIETRVPAGREIVNQAAALLAVALDHEAVVVSLRQQEEQLRRTAVYDGLTGLPNRTLFLERLSLAIARMARNPDYTFAVLFLDLDEFKVVNDSMGHNVGDRLLVQVAGRLLEQLRTVDIAARFGGDEFIVLLEGPDDLVSASAAADRLQSTLAQPYYLAGDEVVVTASVGIVMSAPRYENAEDLLRDADIAMYSAKSHQKGTQAVFDVAMHARAVARQQVEADLRRALEHGEFEVHYQPIVNLETQSLAAFEALIRWQHPSRGLLFPDAFLSVAEACGLIVPIGRWILREACRQLRSWQVSGAVDWDVAISVNISHRQFWHDDLCAVVTTCLQETGLAASQLALELTEGIIMSNAKQARRMLDDLHGIGVALHIDDFGTGYSSLEALHNLPLDALKLDRSFIARLDDPRSAELVRTMVLMGHNLGLDLVAEGVETVDQREHLRLLGCKYAQGYLFSRPVPARIAEQVGRELGGNAVAQVS